MDKYYYRCNTPQQLSEMWNQQRMGANPPTSASWGNCNDDPKRESILSPYPYKRAKEHYMALLDAAKAKGGPTVYTKATVPDWTAITRATRRPITGLTGYGESARRQRSSPFLAPNTRSAWFN